MFKNRHEAGKLLAQKLEHLRGESLVIVAIPRGGLPVGAIIASTLAAPLDVALIKKIGHPYNREFAIGAVSLSGIILKSSMEVNNEYLESEINRLREALLERHRLFYATKQPVNLKNKVVVVTDDGLATGHTMHATLNRIASQKPKAIVIALPVAPAESLEALKAVENVTEVICLETPVAFNAVGQFYEDFSPVSDAEALSIFENN